MPEVALRGWLGSDAPALERAVSGAPDLLRQLPLAEPPDNTDWPALVDRVLAPCTDRARHVAISLDGRAVGNVSITGMEDRHGTAWLSYWLAADARGQGLAAAALATVATWAFEERGLHRLELGHRVDNPASCRVALRAGFLIEGVEREKLRYEDVRHDVENHARLVSDPAPTMTPLSLDRP